MSIVSADFVVMDTNLLVHRQSNGLNRLPIGVGVSDVLRQLELDRLARSERFQHERTAGRVLFNSTGHFGPAFRVGAA